MKNLMNLDQNLQKKEINDTCQVLIEAFRLFYNKELISKIVLNEGDEISREERLTMDQNGPFCGTSKKRNFWIRKENGDSREYAPIVPST